MPPPIDPTARTAALAVLGLPPGATAAQVLDAYRRLVRATHPDVTGRTDSAATREFAAIHDAYELLAGQPAPDRPEPSPNRQPDDGTGRSRERASRPRTATRAFPGRPPIVAGPVIVTPLPEQHRPNPRRQR